MNIHLLHWLILLVAVPSVLTTMFLLVLGLRADGTRHDRR